MTGKRIGLCEDMDYGGDFHSDESVITLVDSLIRVSTNGFYYLYVVSYTFQNVNYFNNLTLFLRFIEFV